jgi:hypothetical protein
MYIGLMGLSDGILRVGLWMSTLTKTALVLALKIKTEIRKKSIFSPLS